MDESRKKTAVIHRCILINVMIFNNLRKKSRILCARCYKNRKCRVQAMSRCQISCVSADTRTGSSEHRALLLILLIFNTLPHIAEIKFVDESRKKTATIHCRVLDNMFIFNNLHKKILHFVCSLQQKQEVHDTGHVQMPDVVGARRYKNRKQRAQGLPYLREILRLLTDQPKKPRTFPNEKYSPWQ